jgi:hypothetical protein
MRTGIVYCAALLSVSVLVSAASAALPTYIDYELQARASFSTPFNVPAGASFSSTTPTLNNSRHVAFAFSEPVNFDKQIWSGEKGIGAPITTAYERASDPHINDAGDITWSAGAFFGTSPDDGVWRAVNDVPTKLTTGPASADDWGEPYIGNDGTIGYRPEVFGDKRYTIYDPAGNTFNTVAQEGASFGFLAQPAYNNNGQFGAHVWDATQGDASQLRRFDSDGSSKIMLQEDAEYNNFFNGVDINDGGQLAAQLFRSDGGTDLALVDDSGVTVLASDNSATWDSFAFFDPKINNSGIVAFRGTQTGQPEAIYITDGTELAKVIGVGDQVMTDQGLAQITSLANGWDINDDADVVFNASVSLIGGGSIGRGIFVAQTPEPATGLALLAGALLFVRRR